MPSTTCSLALGMVVNISPDTVFVANSPAKPIPLPPTAHAVHDETTGMAVDIHDAPDTVITAIIPPDG
jgi:hypothetical protein